MAKVILAFFIFSTLMTVFDRAGLGAFGWVPDLAVQFTPQLALAGMGLLGCFCITRNWTLFSWTLFPATVHVAALVSFTDYTLPNSTPSPSLPSLKIMTVNTWEKDVALYSVAEIAFKNNLDVIVINEMTSANCNDISDIFEGYPYCRIVSKTADGTILTRKMAIFAKRAPLKFNVHYKDVFLGRAILEAYFQLGAETIKLVAVHPPAPGTPSYMMARNRALLFASGLVDGQENFVLAGDMNTTPWSRVYRRMIGRRVSDPRLESTWLSRLPLLGLPIDHIRIGSGVTVNGYEVGKSIGSDHRPLTASVSVTVDE